MTYRLGVDVGGTFTDLVLHDVETNRLEFAKTPSTPENQATGVATGIKDRVNRLKCLGNGIVPASLSLFLRGR